MAVLDDVTRKRKKAVILEMRREEYAIAKS
jgi:hypothetical protein